MIVYTIGYEGSDFDSVVAALQRHGVEVLVDVRALPISRKPNFSKRRLSVSLEENGIEYLHLGALGDPKAGREAARAGRLSDFRRVYQAHLLRAKPKQTLQGLVALCSARVCCLLCFERDHTACHRSIVADRLSAKGLTVHHLRGDAPARHGSSRRPRRNLGESAAAA
jgi:uncharacterized protein (DUF488 family)